MPLALAAGMLATTATTTLLGLEAHLVRVEVESSRGPGFFDLVGLAEASVRESRVRIRSALGQLGLSLDEHRIVVNLAPGDIRKTGSAFDLAIALAVLAATGAFPAEELTSYLILGEMSLTGEVRSVPGVLPQLLFARQCKFTRALVPFDNGSEASVIPGVQSALVPHLRDALEYLRGRAHLDIASSNHRGELPATIYPDLADVRGQHAARRALEIAAAGHHHLLFIGPPGGGKTMLARRMGGILPPLSDEETLETSAVHSVAGLLPPGCGLLSTRPFRAPHHTVSDAGLVGGGYPPRPGELSLAHHGVLFLDELAEFRRSTLETLRQPLEDGILTIARARARAQFPARPLLVAASNPCPCGYYGDGTSRCGCPPELVRRYLARLSGPLLDRLDIHVILPPVEVASLTGKAKGEASAVVRERVLAARQRQEQRYQAGQTLARNNASLASAELTQIAALDSEAEQMLTASLQCLGLSARAYTKVLKLARTIADLAAESSVRGPHVAEAIQLRAMDRAILTTRKAVSRADPAHGYSTSSSS